MDVVRIDEILEKRGRNKFKLHMNLFTKQK